MRNEFHVHSAPGITSFSQSQILEPEWIVKQKRGFSSRFSQPKDQEKERGSDWPLFTELSNRLVAGFWSTPNLVAERRFTFTCPTNAARWITSRRLQSSRRLGRIMKPS